MHKFRAERAKERALEAETSAIKIEFNMAALFLIAQAQNFRICLDMRLKRELLGAPHLTCWERNSYFHGINPLQHMKAV